MINPVQTSVPQEDGNDRFVIIEPILEKNGAQDLRPTAVFKIFKDGFSDGTHFSTEPGEIDEQNGHLPDDENPDHLGSFLFENGNVKHFKGQGLSVAEQAYLAVFIETYQEPDI